MSITAATLQNLQSHWAVSLIPEADRVRAAELVNERLVQQTVGGQISFDFAADEADEALLERMSLAYEIAAVEGLDALSRTNGGDDSLRGQAAAASHNAFDIRRLAPIPENTEERIFHVLQLASIAYCGDRWSDLRRWFKENKNAIIVPSLADTLWDRRLLYRLFECWVHLFRKDGWNDLNSISAIISGLREDQQIHEKARLDNGSTAKDRAIALRLIALYHWAKATEILAEYMLQGQSGTIFGDLDKHFESGIKAATAAGDVRLEMIMRWLHAASRIMVSNSLWWGARAVNSRVSSFVKALTERKQQAMYELLPPQRSALLEQNLLDPAKTAIVIDMPTSGGKTLLAQFRILQALNQFDADGGWVAYVAPTRALTAQITRRLRRDFQSMGLRVEQLTGAIEINAFEGELLTDKEKPFDVLVATPEKLSLVIRNKRVSRPLALVVMDEAHNLESEGRGLRIEFLLATIKRDCRLANFLLLMPYVEQSETVARWLADDVKAGNAISFSTTAWRPNERIIGLYSAVADDSERAGWRLEYETLTVTERAMKLRGKHRVGDCKPIDVPRNKVLKGDEQSGLALQTAAMATIMSARGTSVAVANKINLVWSMARQAMSSIRKFDVVPDEVRLVQDFLKTEVSRNFELIEMLDHGIGVHHAGLSDEIRTLMEWLAESGHLRVLCATTTLAQGINFPVSSMFLQSHKLPYGVDMSPREFWNLAGRAGRIGQDSVGVIGLAQGNDKEAKIGFLSQATGALASRLVVLLDELDAQGKLHNLESVLWQNQWQDFRCYIAHLCAEKQNLDAVLAESEQLLRHTYGYTTLRNDPKQQKKADVLLHATKNYVRTLAKTPGIARLADLTGFSPEGVQKAMQGLLKLEGQLGPDDWTPESLFGNAGRMAELFGIMVSIPQLKEQLDDIVGEGTKHSRLSDITSDWVNGVGLEDIAKKYFSQDGKRTDTEAFTEACKAIYRAILNNGTWGVSALSHFSGMDFDNMSEAERRRIHNLPAMIYYGVRTEDAVLMRMNSAPRSVAERLGLHYREAFSGDDARYSVAKAHDFLKGMSANDWDRVRPEQAPLGGAGYKKVWEVLAGEGD